MAFTALGLAASQIEGFIGEVWISDVSLTGIPVLYNVGSIKSTKATLKPVKVGPDSRQRDKTVAFDLMIVWSLKQTSTTEFSELKNILETAIVVKATAVPAADSAAAIAAAGVALENIIVNLEDSDLDFDTGENLINLSTSVRLPLSQLANINSTTAIVV